VKRPKKNKLNAGKLSRAFTLVGGSLVANFGGGGRIETCSGRQNRVHLEGLWLWEGFAVYLINKYNSEK
jgi:hypothetical protein